MAEVEVSYLFVNNSPTLTGECNVRFRHQGVMVWSKFGRVPMIRKPSSDCPHTFEILLAPYPQDWLPAAVDVLCCDEGAKLQRKGPFQQDGTPAPGTVETNTTTTPGLYQPPPPKVPAERTNGKGR